jgi:hypothetical protein
MAATLRAEGTNDGSEPHMTWRVIIGGALRR